MDLSRAKTVLIIAFLVLNIFLGYRLWLEPQATVAGPLISEKMEQVEQELAEANLSLAVSFPRQIQRSSLLAVKPADYGKEALTLLRVEEEHQVERMEDRQVYTTSRKELTIHRSGLISYERAPGLDTQLDFADNNEAVEAMEAFLQEHELMPPDAHLDQVQEEEDGRWVAHYLQKYQGLPIYSSSLKIIMGERGVELLELFWLTPLGLQEGNEMEVISSITALRRLVENLGPMPEEKEVTEISFGFYSQDYDAQKWEVPPVWRICVNNETVYYINAFTGNMEESRPAN